MKRFERILISKLILPVLFFGAVFAGSSMADTGSANQKCAQPVKAPKDLGILVVSGLVTDAPVLEWGTQQGCFKKYGLGVKSVIVASTTVAAAGLVSNSYDIIVSSPTNLIQLMTNGSFSVRIVAPRYGYTTEELTRAKEETNNSGKLLLEVGLIVKNNSPIKSFKDLENKKVGLQKFQSATHGGVIMGIKENRGDPAKTQFLVVPGAQTSDALQRGDVDAVAVGEPFASQAILAGGRLIGYPPAYYNRPGAILVYGSSESIVKKRRTAMIAFQKAVLEINRLLNQPENDASFRQMYANTTGVDAATAANVRLPVLMEKPVTYTSLYYLPFQLFRLGFTRTVIDITQMTRI